MSAHQVAQSVPDAFVEERWQPGVRFMRQKKRKLIFWDSEGGPNRPTIITLDPEGMSNAEYLAAVHAAADDLIEEAICYFVGGAEGPVKIGHAKNMRNRLVALQNGSPVRLSVLATASGGLTRETAYHFQFAEYRLHGEWFERVPAIQAEIERLNRASMTA
jgi:hypothetical protein